MSSQPLDAEGRVEALLARASVQAAGAPAGVEENDACAIYASVRKDATPEPRADRAGDPGAAEDAPPGRQRRRRGRRLRPDARPPAQDLGRGGPGRRPRPGADPRRRLRRRPRLHRALPGPRADQARRPRAARRGRLPDPRRARSARSTRPRSARPRARRSRSSGRSPASSPRPRTATRSSSSCCSTSSAGSASTSPRFSATTCVYKVMGSPNVLGAYYPDLTDPRFETIGAFGHNRYSTNTWPSFKRVQPFSVLGHNGEINTIEQLRQEAKMLAVQITPGGSDSQDLNLTIDTMVSREGLSLAEAMEMVLPPIVAEIRKLPEELQGFYMYLHQAMGPFSQGPVALIARHGDECVFSADAMGLRPLWKVETESDHVFSSEPGVVSVHDMVSEPQPMAPGEKAMVLIDRAARASTLHPHAEMLRIVKDRWLARNGVDAVAPYERALETGGPLEGAGRPRLHGSRPGRAGAGRRPRARRLRLAARRRQTRPADGLQRGRAGRLAGLRRAAGGALAGAPEPRRLLQGDGRRGHQPGARSRTRARALLDPDPVRAAALDRLGGRGHGDGRNRLPGGPRRPPRAGAALRQDLPQDRPRPPHLPARGPLGGVPRPRQRGRHLAAGVGDDGRARSSGSSRRR